MICSICKLDKPIEDLVKRNDRVIGYRKLCKSCKVKKNDKAKNSQYYQDHKEEIRESRKIRRHSNINERIANSLRARMRIALKSNKTDKTLNILGCSIDFLKIHLEVLFQSGMTWDNYGEWHIDHIKPLSKFDLTDSNQVLIACNYNNLQPLWAIDNLRKGAK